MFARTADVQWHPRRRITRRKARLRRFVDVVERRVRRSAGSLPGMPALFGGSVVLTTLTRSFIGEMLFHMCL